MSKFSLTAQLQLQAPTNVRQVVNQIQSQLNSVSVNVSVTGAAKTNKQLKQIDDQTKAITSSADKMGKTFGLSIRRFAAFSVATRAVGLFTAKLSNAVDEAIDFQREMIKVSQVTGKTISELRGLSNEIDFLSKSLGVSSKSLLSVTRILAQAGIQANDLKTALGALAKSTLAPTFDNITQTAEGAVAVLAQFGQGVGALERQLGSINAVAGQFAVEAGDLISVVRRAGGVFKASGGNLNELIALFTSVRATTRESADSIATGLRTIFTRIQRPKTIEYLKQFGVELQDLNGKFVGPFNAAKQLSEALSGLGERDVRFIQIAEELGGFRQIGKVIPFLQQFTVAERARQAALAGGESLNKDAVTAQKALAVQISKVREEFLSLIRTVANTSSFQIFVKSSLQLASALIKIGEAVKPLIPLLVAFTGFKLAKGFGTFAKGVGSSLSGGGATGLNGGGRVHAFATGGIVPGVGNTDSVPAMLSPGEFVIKKSSVGSIGAGNLAAMNQGGAVQKFADGGTVNAGGILHQNKVAFATADFIDDGPIKGKETMTRKEVAKAFFGGSNLNKLFGQAFVEKNMGDPTVFGSKKIPKYSTMIEGVGPDEEAKFAGAFSSGVHDALQTAGDSISKTLGGGKFDQSRVPQDFYDKFDAGFKGLLFENVIRGYNGQPLAGLDTQAPFDFTGGLGQFGKAYSNIGNTKYVDGKISLSAAQTPDEFKKKITAQLASDAFAPLQKISRRRIGTEDESDETLVTRMLSKKGSAFGDSEQQHVANILGVSKTYVKANKAALREERGITGFNRGGAAGSDTVPAVLTPGEFVVSAGAAKSIGYGNLNRMNQHGVKGYAQGGIVQGFNNGSTGTGVKSLTGKGTGADLAGLFALQSIPAIIQSMAGSTEKVNTATSRVVDSMATMVSTTTALVFSMQAFGLQLTAGGIGKFFGTGQGSLRSIIKKGIVRTKSLGRAVRGSGANVGNLGRAGESFGYGFRDMSDFKDDNRFQSGLNKFSHTIGSGLGRIPGARGAASGISRASTGIANSALGRGAGKLGGLAKQGAGALGSGLSSVAGKLIKFAGPMAGLTAGFTAINSLLSAGFGYQEKYNKAVEKGNVARARELAVLKEVPGFVQAIDYYFDGAADVFADFVADFGGSSANTIKANAEAAALAARHTKNLAINAQKASDAMKDIAAGNTSIEENFASGNLTGELGSANATLKGVERAQVEARKDLNNLLGFSGGTNPFGETGSTNTRSKGISATSVFKELNPFGTGFAQEDVALNEALQKAQQGVAAQFDKLMPKFTDLAASLAITTDGTATLDDFLNNLNERDREIVKSQGSAEIEKRIKAQNEAAIENAAYLKALNFGLRNVVGQARAVTGSLSRLNEAQTTGFNSFSQSISVLEQSMTEAAVGMNPKEIEDAQKDLSSTLRSFGASEVEIDKAKGSMQGLYKAQSFASKALEGVAQDLSRGGTINPQAIKDSFRKSLTTSLESSGISQSAQDSVVDALSNIDLNDNEIRKQIKSGNFEGVLQQAFGPLSEALKKQVLGPLVERAKQEGILIKLTQTRIALEQSSIKTKQQAIDIELEAANAIQDFGGAVVTAADKAGAANRQLDLSLGGAGVRGVGSGTPQEVARAQQELLSKFNRLQNEQNTAAANGGGAFANSGGVDRDSRGRLKSAQAELVKFSRQRISQIKEELSIIQKKNALEKSSLDSLLTGDIQKFFDQQASAGAASALRSGNTSLLGSFSTSALAGGFQSLKDQGLPPQELQKVAAGVLGALGIKDSRSAGILSGNTREEQIKNQEGRQFAGILGAAGAGLGRISEMEVIAQNVVIQASGLQGIQNKNAEGQRLEAAQTKSTGGTIYANRGMFIPRGTDTVPAMLTPGEYVVNRAAVKRGNNLSVLKAMNGSGASAQGGGTQALSQGGAVRYYYDGGDVHGGGGTVSSEMVNQLSHVFTKFSESVQSLANMQIHVKLDTANINVNFNGTSFLHNLNNMVKDAVLQEVKNQIPNLSQNMAGEPTLNTSVLG